MSGWRELAPEEQPAPGDLATHKYKQLDARAVSRIERPGARDWTQVWLQINQSEIGPFDAANYTFLRRIDAELQAAEEFAQVVAENDQAKPVDDLFATPVARLPYNGKSRAGHSEAGDAALEAEDSGGTTAARQAATLAALEHAGTDGLTTRQLGEKKGWHHGQASGVLSVLHKAGDIVRLQVRRDRQSVYVLPHLVDGRDVSVRRHNANVQVVSEPDVRYVEVEVPTVRPLSPQDRQFLDELKGALGRHRAAGTAPFRISTIDRLVNIIERSTS